MPSVQEKRGVHRSRRAGTVQHSNGGELPTCYPQQRVRRGRGDVTGRAGGVVVVRRRGR